MTTAQKIAGSLATMALLATAGTAFAAAPTTTAPGHNKIQCFSGTTDGAAGGGFSGTCATKNSGVNSPVVLSNDSSNPLGDYSGAFFQNSTLGGQLLGSVTKLGYTYSGNISPLPGDLSLNVPIDTDGNGTTDAYAFVDAYYCPGTNGVVNVISDTDCGIFVNGVEYSNWAALVAANPTWSVATDAPAFIVAERTPSEPSAVWTVSNVVLGQSK